MIGTYLYAIMRGERRLDFGRLGLPDGWAPVATLPSAGLTAVVSEYRGPALGGLPRADLLRFLSIHQRVVERAMADQPVLPARFGTILGSRDEIATVLGRFERRLTAALAQLSDAVEIEVAATWDLKRIFAEISREPSIAALAAGAAGAAGRSAEESLALRIQIGRAVKETLDRRRQEVCRQVLADLVPLVRDAQPNPIVADDLVLNVAFLIERTRLDDFYARVHRQDEAFENRLTFRCVGPLPPYSFAAVEISHLRADEIEAARRLLGLGEHASATEINAGYRRLAATCHPDRNPDDPTAPARFAALTAAHSRLLAYVHGQRISPEDDAFRYDLSGGAADGGLLLAIKRSAPEPIQQGEAVDERDAVVV
ncbi:MAG: GvpL/GvpF family gas vesicle protein [Chloroflexi bacterium]|nr:GvpL/GvpF family gas vesicle protein [Chloroflexota bacterium]